MCGPSINIIWPWFPLRLCWWYRSSLYIFIGQCIFTILHRRVLYKISSSLLVSFYTFPLSLQQHCYNIVLEDFTFWLGVILTRNYDINVILADWLTDGRTDWMTEWLTEYHYIHTVRYIHLFHMIQCLIIRMQLVRITPNCSLYW